jgi:NadR type nicotinamide-nucleotide adenylyltransferase
MLKIVITGPESTGKSTLAEQLEKELKAPMVKEYSRLYLENLGRPYVQSDLVKIAKGQIEKEDSILNKNLNLVICDTSLEVIKIWSNYKYDSCDPFILTSLMHRQPDLYLLMRPDLPWQDDPLRENPIDRDRLFIEYKKELSFSQLPFFEIYGNESDRFALALKSIKPFLNF